MAIAGAEPVSYLEIGEDNKTEIYTRNQVREILIKFEKEYEIDGRAYEMGETLEDFVDEFMKMGD